MKSEARTVDLGNGQEAIVYNPAHYIDGSETYLIIRTHIDPSLDQIPFWFHFPIGIFLTATVTYLHKEKEQWIKIHPKKKFDDPEYNPDDKSHVYPESELYLIFWFLTAFYWLWVFFG